MNNLRLKIDDLVDSQVTPVVTSTDPNKKYGILNIASGSEYVGEIVNGHMHGKGTFSWISGHEYEGDFKDNKRHGKGQLVYKKSNECKCICVVLTILIRV